MANRAAAMPDLQVRPAAAYQRGRNNTCQVGFLLHALQLRMSKKIAQLTKVIYHLNTKSEDHDLDLQEMAEHYEAEIESILRSDTQSPVNHDVPDVHVPNTIL
jgi:hypothetical protein